MLSSERPNLVRHVGLDSMFDGLQSKMINRTPRAGLKTAVSPDDSGVQLPGVQVDHCERGRGEAFTETSQHSPEDLHICGETHLESLLVSAAELISDQFSN